MKYDIYTQLSEVDLKLAQNVIATSSFETLSNYFIYVINNLTNAEIINPIQNARQLISERDAKPLLMPKFRHIVLNINDHELSPSFLKDLALTLSVNSFWTIDKIFDYAICQLLTNCEMTFSFNFEEHDQLLIDGAVSKSVLVQMDDLASDYDQAQTEVQRR